MSDYCPPPKDRLCDCRQCRADWKEREREMQQHLAEVLGITFDAAQQVAEVLDVAPRQEQP